MNVDRLVRNFKRFLAYEGGFLSFSGTGTPSGSQPPAGTGTISVSTTTYGTAPMMVEFDVTLSSGFGSDDIDLNCDTVVVVDGQPLTAYNTLAIANQHQSADFAFDAKAVMCFPEPDTTYTGWVWVRSRTDGTVGVGTWSIDTGVPDTTYATTATIAYDPSDTFAGLPAGATEVTDNSGLQSAITSLEGTSTDYRVVLARGQTFTALNLGSGLEHFKHLGAFGSGDDPVVNLNISGVGVMSLAAAATGWTVANIDFQGQWEADKEIGRACPIWDVNQTAADHCIIYGCTFDGCDNLGTHLKDNGSGAFLAGMFRTKMTNWQDYGWYITRNDDAKYAIVGCDFRHNVNALNRPNSGPDESINRDEMSNLQGPVRAEGYDSLYVSNSQFLSRTTWIGSNQPCLRCNTLEASGARTSLHMSTFEGSNTVDVGGDSGIIRFTGNTFIPGPDTGNLVRIYGDSSAIFHSNYFWQPNVPSQDSFPMSNGAINYDNTTSSNPIYVLYNTRVSQRSTTNDPGDDGSIVGNTGNLSNLTQTGNVVHAPNQDSPVDASLDLSAAIAGLVPQYVGEIPSFDRTLHTPSGSVANSATETVSYPDGTDQTYWNARFAANDEKHMLRAAVGGNYSVYWAHTDYGDDFDVVAGGSGLEITNKSGSTWDTNQWQIRFDRSDDLPAADTTYANPSTAPLPSPTSSTGTTDANVPAYDLLGNPRRMTADNSVDWLNRALPGSSSNPNGAIGTAV